MFLEVRAVYKVGLLVDYGTPHGVPEDQYQVTPFGEAAEGRIAEAVVEAY